jgi:hypothetical protein
MNYLADILDSTNGNLVAQANFEELDRRLGGYIHYQNSAAAVWEIYHNLGKQYVQITIVDSSNIAFVGEIEFVDQNHARASFNFSIAGKASCF